jgi:uncharacterized membrane protein
MRFNSLLGLLRNLDLEPCIAISIGLAALVFFLMPSTVDFESRILATWSSGIICFLTFLLFIFSDSTPEKTRNRAQRREPNAQLVLTLVIFTALASIFAIGFMLSNGKGKPEEVALSIVAILCSWLLTHTTFALHYARYYYDDDGLGFDPEKGYVGGLEFPDEQSPDYLDFMYFAFTISMTSQTSDISITSRPLRRIVLAHEIVSFFFYTIIIGFVVNTIDGLI